MNQQQRDELREQHSRDENGYCKTCGVRSFDGDLFVIEWHRCPVTKVLNAWEAEIRVRTEGEGR